MDASAVTIRELLEHRDSSGIPRPVQFRIPIFQRDFSWGTEQIDQLMRSILDRASAKEGAAPHFLGAFVLMQEDDEPNGPDRLMVIDGQQRLVTLAVAISYLEGQLNVADSSLENSGVSLTGRERVEPAEVDFRDFEEIRRGPRATLDWACEVRTRLRRTA